MARKCSSRMGTLHRGTCKLIMPLFYLHFCGQIEVGPVSSYGRDAAHQIFRRRKACKHCRHTASDVVPVPHTSVDLFGYRSKLGPSNPNLLAGLPDLALCADDSRWIDLYVSHFKALPLPYFTPVYLGVPHLGQTCSDASNSAAQRLQNTMPPDGALALIGGRLGCTSKTEREVGAASNLFFSWIKSTITTTSRTITTANPAYIAINSGYIYFSPYLLPDLPSGGCLHPPDGNLRCCWITWFQSLSFSFYRPQ